MTVAVASASGILMLDTSKTSLTNRLATELTRAPRAEERTDGLRIRSHDFAFERICLITMLIRGTSTSLVNPSSSKKFWAPEENCQHTKL